MRLERKAFELRRPGGAREGSSVLIALGGVEGALARGGRQTQELAPLRQVPAGPWLEAADDGTLEFSLAAAIVSLHDAHPAARTPALRDYLHGTTLDEHSRRSYGESHAVIPRRSAPVARLAALHARRHLDAARAEAGPALGFRYGLACPLAGVEALAAGAVEGRRIMALLEGLALLDFAGASWASLWRTPRCPCRCSDCSRSRGAERLRRRSPRVWVGRLGLPPAMSGLCSGTRFCD